jgi:hypothetical protein
MSRVEDPLVARIEFRGVRTKNCDCFRAWRKDLEIFTGGAIEGILRLLIWGARLRWAARADNEPTATEGGDPSGTYKRWSVAS